MYIKTGNPICFYLPVFSLKLMFMMPAAVDFLVSSWWTSLGLYLQLCIIPAPYFVKQEGSHLFNIRSFIQI